MSKPAPPKALRGFADIDRYWDRRLSQHAAKIKPGEFYVTKCDEAIVTVLGSCVSACIRDPAVRIGGMNHFMLPFNKSEASSSWNDGKATRYGTYAMEQLINEILKYGGEKKRLEVKVFGGGRVLATMTDIGAQNISFVREFLREEQLAILSEDLGDDYPRKVYYFPHTGKVRMMKLRTVNNDTIERRERAYQSDLEKKPVSGDVELF